jgi:hypothetical protein
MGVMQALHRQRIADDVAGALAPYVTKPLPFCPRVVTGLRYIECRRTTGSSAPAGGRQTIGV